MTMNKALENLAAAMGLPKFELEPGIPLDFIVKEIKFSLVHNPEPGIFSACAEVAELPGKGDPARARLVRALMEANFNWSGTDGSVFCLNPGGWVLIERSWFLPFKNAESFPDELGRMILLAGEWRKKAAAETSPPQVGYLGI
jgi:hypothetical protein